MGFKKGTLCVTLDMLKVNLIQGKFRRVIRGRVVPEGPPAPSLQQVVMDFKKVHFETLDMVKAFHGML
jgi:hypothetical protein